MQLTFDQWEQMAAIQMQMIEHPALDDVEKAVNNLKAIPGAQIDDEMAAKLVRSLEARYQITMSLGSMLQEAGWKNWLSAKRGDIEFFYWDRYEKYLLRDKRHSNQVVASIDKVTHNVLDQLQDPTTPGRWDRRGLVMGYVQSGKTSNYIGLINKAADAGYKVIIVIAGTTNILRRQTQERVDEGFVGRDSSAGTSRVPVKAIGVGQQEDGRIPLLYTNTKRDFNTQTAGVPHSLESFRYPSVFVIKKNSSTLNSLITWLKAFTARGRQSLIDLPMLLIDDEADNASINTKSSNNGVSAINARIRELLRLFSKKSYVGYTATPFANIFIDPDATDGLLDDDLFPRNFILSLDPPTSYFGPEEVFGDNSDRYVRFIDDNYEYIPVPHKKDLEINGLPESLRTAIRAYILGRAIRIHDGQEFQHSSMMINASVFNGVQNRLAAEVHDFVRTLRNEIKVYAALSQEDALKYNSILQLKSVFDQEYSRPGVTWNEIQRLLLRAIAPIDVVQINSQASGALDYDQHNEQGRHVIAVGGYSLSRGVTLEGLQISYFLRNSMAYDTLMQMGRWFGYRPGYQDLCRIWMPEQAFEWYAHVTESISLLRDELRRMEQAKATPLEFGLRVRSHPDTLVITARNKLGASVEIPDKVGLADMLIETVTLKADKDVNRSNLDAVISFVDEAERSGVFFEELASPHGWLGRGIASNLITRFVESFEPHPVWHYSDPRLVNGYIEANTDELGIWDVFIPSLINRHSQAASGTLSHLIVNYPQRSRNIVEGYEDRLILSKRAKIASRGAERVGLTPSQERAAYDAFEKAEGQKPDKEIPDKYFRRQRKRPLLILHLLNVTEPDGSAVFNDPVAAWSISFPNSDRPQKTVSYVANATFIREQHDLQEMNEDEEMLSEHE